MSREPRRPSRASVKPFEGQWRITEMQVWGQEAVETLGPGFFEFDEGGTGGFRFICVEGDMTCRFTTDERGRPLVRFSWSGFDEFRPVNGRGWAVARGTRLRGRICFDHGDDSAFEAARADEAIDTTSKRPRRKWRR